tara:strand:- start:515 stop:925 length:411 start_codon:yes stop_codon:yes gene_type:complete
MASLLKVDALTGVTTAGSISVTGEGNSTTTNLQQGLAKAFAQIKGTDTFGINESFNISSAADEGTGHHNMTMSSAMTNATAYIPTGTCGHASGNPDSNIMALFAETTTVVEIETSDPADNNSDTNTNNIVVFGDLA